ncbi:hypothetical protein AB0O87_11870 [Microbacterium sp. NPDC076768]|uniref:hypothetical protein n=1 Tax=Microbacterium sp. NPDC076768 TaxID=3154858 RepID=UPI00342C882D
MDVLERVRNVNVEASLTEAEIGSARSLLLNGIDASLAQNRKRALRWSFVIVSALAGVAAVTAGVVMLNQTPTPTPRIEAAPPVIETPPPTATATPRETEPPVPTPVTASSVLSAAAKASGASTTPSLQEGQYLKVEREVNTLVLYGPSDTPSLFDASRADASAAWIARSHWSVYVPADRSSEWVREFPNQDQLTAFYGEGAESHAQEWLGGDREPFYLRTTGGLGEAGPGEPSRASEAYYSEFPRDPQALLEWVRASNGAVDSSEQSLGTAAEVLIEELQYNTAPPDLQASMYEALALLPQSTIAGVDGNITTIAFAANESRWGFNEISIDTTTGLAVGSLIRYDSGTGIVPSDVADSWERISVSVVDSAP